MRTGRRGSALLTVLWLTAALAAIGLAVANNVRGETERAATNVDDAKAYFLARGAIERAGLHVLWANYRTADGQPIYYRWGQPALDLSFPGGEAHVEVTPETSKLNLNASRPEDIFRLLVALGVPENRAEEITAAIVDWRTPVTPDRQSPFDAFYLGQSPSFLPRHASFFENEELLQVKGVTPDLYFGTFLGNGSRPGLRDCISVYGSADAVDINSAQLPTLIAIGLSPEDAAAVVRLRDERPVLDWDRLGAIAKSLGPVGARLRYGGISMFTLRATARLKQPDGKLSDMRRTVAATVKFSFPGNPDHLAPGFEVVRWYDRI